MDFTRLGDTLALVNATLNALSAVFLVSGLVFIRRRQAHRHRRAMRGALSTSALFLVFYLTRVSLTGTHQFAGEGSARVVYLTILFSHMILAAAVAPLVLRLLYLLARRRFHDHARLARRVLPVWLYVSITGLVVYLLLYQVYGYR